MEDAGMGQKKKMEEAPSVGAGGNGVFLDNLWQLEVWERLAPQLTIKNLVLLACTHRQLNIILIEDSIWRASLCGCVDVAFDLSLHPEEGLTWRYLAMQVLEGLGRLGHSDAEGFPPANVHVLSDVSDQLAVKALSSSTQDRPEEDTKHVLTRSRCQTGKKEDQKSCPCKGGEKPCYWSSCATPDPNTNEWISFRLNAMVCLVHSITIQPYQAWWQEVNEEQVPPIYAPQGVRVEFGALDETVDADGRQVIKDTWVWSAVSKTRKVPHSSQGLEWEFKRPLLVVGGYCKIHLLGKVQRQTVVGQDDYYCCISHVGLRGSALRALVCHGLPDDMPSDAAAAQHSAAEGVCDTEISQATSESEMNEALAMSVPCKIQLLKAKAQGGVPKQCGWCGTHEKGDGSFRCPAPLNICTGCRRVYYCGTACQKKHRSSHKKICQAVS